MAIFEDVNVRMKGAMKARDAALTSALRNIRAALLTETKKDGTDTLADDRCIDVIRRLGKQRKESIEAFEGVGRADQAAAERAELAVVESFLPRLADEAATRAWVQEAIAASGATTAKEVGKVMGLVMKAHKGDVDGDLTRRLALEILGT